MKEIFDYIADHQTRFRQHPMIELLSTTRTRLPKAPPKILFWVYAFQDIIRLTADLIPDDASDLKARALHHLVEDTGHHLWLQEDLRELGQDVATEEIFGATFYPSRVASYALVSEVFRCSNDKMRIVLLYLLETVGHVFFETTAAYCQRFGIKNLKYFSSFHIEVEKSHDMFDQQSHQSIDSLTLTPEEREEARFLADRVYASFEAMFDDSFRDFCGTEKERYHGLA